MPLPGESKADSPAPESLQGMTPDEVKEAYDVVLYLDSAPSWDFVRLETIIAPFQQAVEVAKGAYYYGVIPFNEGTKMVANEIAGAIAAGKLRLPPHIVINSSLPASLMVFEVLVRYAKGVVRGSK